MKALNWLAAVGVTAIGVTAHCGGLFAPFTMDSASVMPKGVRSFRVGGFTTEITDKYNGYGDTEILGNGFNKKVTWGELIDSTPAGIERGQFKGGLEAMGVNMSDFAGDAHGIANSRVTATVPVFAMGVTEKLTMGVAVPVLYSNVNVSTGWTASPAFQAKLNQLMASGFRNKALSYKSMLYNVVATRLANYGYKPLVNEEHTEVGDVTLAGKYQAYKDEQFAVAIAPRVVLPTGRSADVDKVVDVAPGDGQADLGVAAVGDYKFNGKVTLSAGASYTYQMASQKAKRVPLSSDESASPDVDWNVREKLGDLMGTSLGARYQAHRLWTIGTAYSLQYKARDQYEGNAFGPERYGYISQDTEAVMHAGQVGVTFSTVPLYLSKQFEVPLEATVNFTKVLAGRNVNNINLTSVELAAYF